MFNVVPQWHPLRLAEDFALADVLTGGRMEFGVGRGTVPREAWALGTVVASGDNEMSAEHDRINREVFEEAMEVIKLAWSAGALRLPRQALRVPARRRARPRHLRQRPHAHPQAAADGRHLPARDLARDDRVRAPGRPQGGVLAAERRQPEGEVGPLRRDPRARSASRSARARTAASCSTSTSPPPASRRSCGAGPGTTSSASSWPRTAGSPATASRTAPRCPSTSSPRWRTRCGSRSRWSAPSTTPSTSSASGATCST